jgi:hypothetical protein
MMTNSFLEHYLTLFAWIVNNGIFDVLRDTGIAAIPIACIVLGEWLRARAEGADEGNKAVLATTRIENKVYVAYLVILFAFVPVITLQLNDLKLDQKKTETCARSTYDVSKSALAGQFEDTLGGQTAKVPVWWFLVHSVSKGITNAAISAIPCKPDYKQAQIQLDETRINNKALLGELKEFVHDCYGAARYEMESSGSTANVSEKDQEKLDADTGWVGSPYLSANYYSKLFAQKPQQLFPYDAKRDAGHAAGPNGGGYPTCADWWSDSTKGLKARILKSVDTTTWEEAKSVFSTLSGTKDSAQEEMLRQLISPQQLAKNMTPDQISPQYNYVNRDTSITGKAEYEIGSGLTNLFTSIGGTIGYAGLATGMNAVRAALPMVQDFMIMAIIILIPLLLVFGRYQMDVVFAITFGLFAMYFCSFWWELARWMDSSLYAAVFTNARVQTGFLSSINPMENDGIGQIAIEFVEATLYIFLPMFFFMALGWAGVTSGRAFNGILQSGTGPVQEAGKKGGEMGAHAVVGMVKGGISKGK